MPGKSQGRLGMHRRCSEAENSRSCSRFRMAARVGFAVGLTALALPASGWGQYRVYVGGGTSIHQFEASANGQLSPLSPAAQADSPRGLAASPDGKSLYAGNGSIAAGVLQYDIAASGVLTPKSPPSVSTAAQDTDGFYPVVSPNGQNVYVGSGNHGTGLDVIFQFGVGAGGTLNALAPDSVFSSSQSGIAIHPTGSSLYATVGNVVKQYDVQLDGTLTEKTPVNVAAPAGVGSFNGVVVSPDGRSLYATSANPDLVVRYDISLDGSLSLATPSTVPAGVGASGLAISPDGKSLYVTNRDFFTPAPSTIGQYDVAAGGALSAKTPATVPGGADPTLLTVSPDNRSVYVSNFFDATVSQYTAAADGTLSAKTPATVATPGGSFGIVAVPAAALPPPDADGDGVPDSVDACPTVAAATANGCPPATTPPATNPPATTAPIVGPVARPPVVVGAPADKTPPAATLSAKAAQKLGSTVTLKVGCVSEACTARTTGTIRLPKPGRSKAKTLKLKALSTGIKKGATATVKLKLSATARSAIKRALRAGKTISAKVTVTVTDAAGNKRLLTRRVRLR